jgi:hypothetical protein
MKKILLSGVLSLLLAAGAHAGISYWKCELPGGVYMVNLADVASVSTHEYVVDGVARVTEFTVGTTGAVVARFYYLEPMTPKSGVGSLVQSVVDRAQERVEDAADRADVEQVWKKVVKNYPTTTHAHTVEFRLSSASQASQLEKSIEAALQSNQSATIKL